MIKNGETVENIEVEFNSETLLWNDAMILGKHGIQVPQEFIDYDDDNIDYSDNPEITDEDIAAGKIKWIRKAEIPLHKEVEDWIKKEKIDFNALVAELVENFYKTLKNIPKNAAL